MLKVVDADAVGDMLFRWFSVASVVLVVLSLWLISGRSAVALSVVINGACAVAYRSRAIKHLPGAVALAMLNLIYFQFPVFYISMMQSSFMLTYVPTLPHENAWYLTQFSAAMQFFAGCLALTTVGMLVGQAGLRSRPAPTLRITLSRASLVGLVAIGVMVCWTQVDDMRAIFVARAEQSEKAESLIALLFNDKMYQFLFPLVFYLLPLDVNARSSKWWFAGMTALFIFLNVFSTSKGAVLVVGTAFFVFPAAIYYGQGRRIYWPRTAVVVTTILLIVPLYFYAQVTRVLKSTGQELNVTTATDTLRILTRDAEGASALAPIAERVSTNISNFTLVYGEFRHQDDPLYRQDVRHYVWQSFLNLVLPGTPYPESYVPSSQLFYDVLSRQPLVSLLDKATFLASANTQPYTLFGFLMVATGAWQTLALSLAGGLAYAVTFRLFRSVISRSLLVFSATVLYHCYGFEAVAQFVVLMTVSVYFALALLDICGRLTRRRADVPAT